VHACACHCTSGDINIDDALLCVVTVH